ncbi:MAG: response regulator transcription factor [Myxococcales bacterium]|nr:response regulator transcription factor [Myxococcales bacterium]
METQVPVRVTLLEKQRLFRERLADLLERGGFSVVGQYGDCGAFLVSVPSDRPSVAVADLGPSAGDDPRSLLEETRRSHPTLPVLVLASGGEPSSDLCYQQGAAGYLDTREAGGDSLIAAVSALARGERLFPFEMMKSPIAHKAPEPLPPLLAALSLRERQVLSCVAAGADNLKIATLLQISERTVKAHMSKLYLKLGAENRTQLALLALQLGVRPPADV